VLIAKAGARRSSAIFSSMAEDLAQATEFDERTLTFLSRLLYGNSPSIVSERERVFATYLPTLKLINQELEGKLLRSLREWKSYISVPEATLFLINAAQLELLDKGKSVLEFCCRDGVTANYMDLMRILKTSEEMPVDWAVAFHGAEINERYKSTPMEDHTPVINLQKNYGFQ